MLVAFGGSTLVLVNFKVKKGGTSAVAGWRSAPGGFGITFLSSLSGQTIATLDGQHVAMDITEGGAGLTRGPDGKLNGESNTYFRTLHAITLNAGTDGKIGDGATGLDERFYVAGSVPNLDLGTSAITAALCPKDLGTLGLPSGY